MFELATENNSKCECRMAVKEKGHVNKTGPSRNDVDSLFAKAAYLRERNALRSSLTNSSGCSHAAK